MKREQLEVLFRNNLKLLREELGLSQSELARRIKAAPGYINDFEHGRRTPTLGTLAVLAEALGVSPATLVSTIRSKIGSYN